MKKLKTYYSDPISFKLFGIEYYLIFILSLTLIGCQKDFLSKKPDKALIVPTTLNDFQSLLDNSTNIINLSPSLAIDATDDFYTTDAGLLSIASNAAYESNTYLFAKDVYGSINTILDWDTPYQQVFYANVVLDGLSSITPDATTQSQYNQVKGSALFIRAFAFYNLAQEFATPYRSATATQDLGIPIRLTADITQKSVRASIQQTYDQIIGDLSLAQTLLPQSATIKSRPTNIAAMALLARVYLSNGVYDKAATSANSALQLYNKLIDYNTLNATLTKPLPVALSNGNDEVIYYSGLISSFYIISSLTSVDSTLYKSYNNNDLRKQMFYRDRGNGIYTFKGTYSGGLAWFGGLATDELYLIRAECYARQGQSTEAMNDLNTLMKSRWSNKVSYPSFTAGSSKDALAQILSERRKELIGRGLRWTDLRRLNQDPTLTVTIIHKNNGRTYTLSPNDNRYVFPIPEDEIAKSGIQQNPR